jgi:uncharacterized protein YihD (DUF1040 family)
MPRDPQRIDRILNLIAIIWRRSPDLRLSQLLFNFADFRGDIFYIEDDKTEEKLKEYLYTIKRTDE